MCTEVDNLVVFYVSFAQHLSNKSVSRHIVCILVEIYLWYGISGPKGTMVSGQKVNMVLGPQGN